MDYFRPRQRKFGLVTLLIACGLLGLWLRGNAVKEEITLGTNENNSRPRFTHTRDSGPGGYYGNKVSVIAKGYYQIISTEVLTVQRIKVTNPEWSLGLPVGIRETSPDTYELLATIDQSVWRRHCGVFELGERREDAVAMAKYYGDAKGPQLRLTYFTIPYWAIVLPVTLLSAWLLLSKLRPAKSSESPIAIANGQTNNGRLLQT